MAKTPSNMIPLGTPAKQFSLVNTVNNTLVNFNESWDSKATVIMFICNHCPYVKHINHELTKLAQDYIPKGVSFLAINSNDVTAYPDDSPENMKKPRLNKTIPSLIFLMKPRKLPRLIRPPVPLIFIFMILTFLWFIEVNLMILAQETTLKLQGSICDKH